MNLDNKKFLDGEQVEYEYNGHWHGPYDFGYYNSDGNAVLYLPGERNMQDSFVVGINYVRRVNKQPMYYIQNGYVGNAVLWWANGGAGYTTEIAKAGCYTEEDARRITGQRSEDHAWPCDYIHNCDEARKIIIDSQYLDYKYRMDSGKYSKYTIFVENDESTYPPDALEVLVSDGKHHAVACYFRSFSLSTTVFSGAWMKQSNDDADIFDDFEVKMWRRI